MNLIDLLLVGLCGLAAVGGLIRLAFRRMRCSGCGGSVRCAGCPIRARIKK